MSGVRKGEAVARLLEDIYGPDGPRPVRDTVQNRRQQQQPVHIEAPSLSPIKRALAGLYDAPIAIGLGGEHRTADAQDDGAQRIGSSAAVRLPSGDARVSTADEEKILRKAQEIARRRLEHEAQLTERRRLEELEKQAAEASAEDNRDEDEERSRVPMNPERAKQVEIGTAKSSSCTHSSSTHHALVVDAFCTLFRMFVPLHGVRERVRRGSSRAARIWQGLFGARDHQYCGQAFGSSFFYTRAMIDGQSRLRDGVRSARLKRASLSLLCVPVQIANGDSPPCGLPSSRRKITYLSTVLPARKMQPTPTRHLTKAARNRAGTRGSLKPRAGLLRGSRKILR